MPTRETRRSPLPRIRRARTEKKRSPRVRRRKIKEKEGVGTACVEKSFLCGDVSL